MPDGSNGSGPEHAGWSPKKILGNLGERVSRAFGTAQPNTSNAPEVQTSTAPANHEAPQTFKAGEPDPGPRIDTLHNAAQLGEAHDQQLHPSHQAREQLWEAVKRQR